MRSGWDTRGYALATPSKMHGRVMTAGYLEAHGYRLHEPRPASGAPYVYWVVAGGVIVGSPTRIEMTARYLAHVEDGEVFALPASHHE